MTAPDETTAFLDRAWAVQDAAGELVGKLATKEARWTMTVPARADDTDLALTGATVTAKDVIALARRQHAALEKVRGMLDEYTPDTAMEAMVVGELRRAITEETGE